MQDVSCVHYVVQAPLIALSQTVEQLGSGLHKGEPALVEPGSGEHPYDSHAVFLAIVSNAEDCAGVRVSGETVRVEYRVALLRDVEAQR